MRVDWEGLLEPVARELLGDRGEPEVRGRELRWGRKGSFSADLGKGSWFDFEAGVGGGVVNLVEHLRGGGHAEALDWLREGGYLPRDGATRSTRFPAPSKRFVRPPPSPRPGDDAVAHARRALVRALWACGVHLFGDCPGRRYLESRRVWQPFGYRSVRWLASESAPAPVPQARWWGLPCGASGALLYGYTRDGEVVAVGLEALRVDGRRLLERWRRTFGSRAGAAFRVCESDDILQIAEGEIDALAVARACPGSVYAVGGTSGFAGMSALVGAHRELVIHADGDRGGRRAALRAVASVRARGVSARVRWYTTDPAEELAR